MNSTGPLRAAVVGCGKVGSTLADDALMKGDVFTHAEAYSRSDRTQLVAVCDCEASAAEAAAARWGVGLALTNIEEMLERAQPELVSICTPNETHFDVARLVLERGKSVRGILCEKPLATTVEHGRQLVRIAAARGKLLSVVYMRRHAQNLQNLRQYLANGELGEIRAASGWYTKGVLHNGTHWFDLLRMLAGEVGWVEAVDRLDGGSDDPALDVTLGLASGAVATLRAVDSESFSIFEMDLMADRGRVQITDSGHEISVWRASPSTRYSGFVELAPAGANFGHRRDLMLHAVDDLADALATGRQPLSGAEDGLAALRIATAAITAATTGERVEIKRD